MRYVDGFVLPVPRRHLAAYRRMARNAGRVWRQHGAMEYRECVGDDLNVKKVVPFPRSVRAKAGETGSTTPGVSTTTTRTPCAWPP